MSHLNALNELATLTGRPTLGEADMHRALDLLRDGLGAGRTYLVYGVERDFQFFGREELELSRNALWLVNRELVAAGGPVSFAVRWGRVSAFNPLEAHVAGGTHLAALVPASGTSAHMIIAEHTAASGIDAEDADFLCASLPLLGLILQKRLEIEHAESDRRHLSTLVSVGRVISQAEELDAMLSNIAQMTARLTGIDFVSIDLIKNGEPRLRCVNYERSPVGAEGDRWTEALRRPDPIRNMVMATRAPMFFEDAQNDERLPESGRRFFTRTLIRSTAVLPVHMHEESFGVLSVASLKPTDFAQDRELLEGIASQVASAVKGVDLYDERLRAEEALRQSQELLAATIESTADGILVVDGDGRVAHYNERFAQLWRIPPDLLASRDDDKMIQHVLHQLEEPSVFLTKVQQLYASRETDLDTLRFKDGRVFERYSRPLLKHGENVGRVWSFRDITEQKRAEDVLLRQARHDSLTSMLNHAAIGQCLAEAAAEHATVAVVMVDVDGMKAVNDTFGHVVGDHVLVTVANALAADGALVGRYGGDEFMVVLPSADRELGEAFCRIVLDKLAKACVIDPNTQSSIPVVASLGLALYPSEADNVDDLIRLADSAMYAEKRERTAAGSMSMRTALADERAAKMIGEIVPMLTSPGRLDDKLRMVAHRLSLGAGYDMVRFDLAGGDDSQTTTFARVPTELIDEWDRLQHGQPATEIAARLQATRKPLIVDDLWSDDVYTPEQRTLMRRAGLRCAVLVPMLWQHEFVGVLSVAVREAGALDARDARFLVSVADQLAAIIRMESLVVGLESATEHLQAARVDTVVLLAAAAEAHDDSTGRHLRRVRTISELLARELGHEPDVVDAIGLAAVLHDIGKIHVPESILLSPARLNGEEWTMMKRHTIWGAEFLAGRPGFELASAIARAHHERWDGTGYPSGLAGQDIPEAATIVSVADSLDAITNDRPYRAGRSLHWAVDEIVRCAGSQFSPRVVDALVRVHASGQLAAVCDNGNALRDAA